MSLGDEDQLFISYSRDDAEFALKIAKDLRAVGIDIWFDQLDIPPGARWDRSIGKALKASKKLIVILSPSSVASENVMDGEWGIRISSDLPGDDYLFEVDMAEQFLDRKKVPDHQAGVEIYSWKQYMVTVIQTSDRALRDIMLKQLRTIPAFRDASPVNINQWCLDPVEQGDVIKCAN